MREPDTPRQLRASMVAISLRTQQWGSAHCGVYDFKQRPAAFLANGCETAVNGWGSAKRVYPQITQITQIFFLDMQSSIIQEENLCNLRNLWINFTSFRFDNRSRSEVSHPNSSSVGNPPVPAPS